MERTDLEEAPTLKADGPSSYSARNVKQSNKSKQECSNCRRVFFRRNLNRHMLLCKVKNFPCDKCKARFDTEARLDEHRAGHLGQVCSICNKTLANVASLNVHLRNHLGTLPYKCTMCDKGYATGYDLKNHQNRHLGIKPHKCTFCEQSFVTPFELRAHMNRHQNIKPHKCGLCKLAFTSTYELNTHKANNHLATAPHKCFLCPETFTTSTKLNKHLLQHLGLQPYKCNSCMSTFRWITNIRNHVEKFHVELENDIYGCSYCASSFTTANELNEHVRQHPRYKCFSCDESFKTLIELKTHMRVHGAQFYSERGRAAVKRSTLNNSNISDEPKASEDEQGTEITQRDIADGALTDAAIPPHLSQIEEKGAEEKIYMKITDCTDLQNVIIKMENHEAEEFLSIEEREESAAISVLSLHRNQWSDTYANTSQLDLEMTNTPSNASQSIACETLNDDTKRGEGFFDVQLGSNEHEKQLQLDESFLATPALRNRLKNSNNMSKPAVDLQTTHSHSNASQSIACEALEDERLDEHEKQLMQEQSILATAALRNRIKNRINQLKQAAAQPAPLEDQPSQHSAVKKHRSNKCQICFKTFKNGKSLRMHRIQHTSRFKCDYCNKTFQGVSHLEAHIQSHLGIKTNHCTVCKAAFTYSSNLRDHMRTHSGERYMCDTCGRTFFRKDCFEDHRNVHLGTTPYKCNLCPKSYASRGSLWIHKNDYH